MSSVVTVVFKVLLLVIICLGALIGNLVLFYLVFRTRELQTKRIVFILNLAAADLFVAVNMFTTITAVVTDDWIFGSVFCEISGFFTMLTFVASCMALTLISVNRYHGIVHWQNYPETHTSEKCAQYIAFMWFITLGLSLPPLCGWSAYEFDKNQSYCFADWTQSKSYTLFMIAACLICPIIIMTYCYANIIHYTKQCRLRVNEEAINEGRSTTTGTYAHEHAKAALKERKLVQTSISLIVVFALCWSPFAFIMIIEVFSGTKAPRAVDFGSLVLGYMNSFVNVFVYNATNRTIRRGYVKILRNLKPWP